MKYFPCYIVFFLFITWSCEKDPEVAPDISDINLTSEYLVEIMKEYYLWYDELPTSIDITKNPIPLLEDLRYKPLDKWSYIAPTEEHEAYYQQGSYKGYGFGYGTDTAGTVRISFVFDNSPFKAIGAKRGWSIETIDDVAITTTSQVSTLLGGDNESHLFTLKDREGNSYEETFIMQSITMNTVLLDTILQIDSLKIGYLMFKSFITTSREELISAFSKFKNDAIDELIVDLRYNGGGLVDVGLLMGGLIGGSKVENQVMVQYVHNIKQAGYNVAHLFEKNSNSVEIDRVFFITSRNCASASEMVINGLEPFMDVIIVGEETHGKPVGMYSWSFKDFTVAPITFQISNALGNGDYFDGISVDAFAKDDITREFGDTNELCLKETLYYIANDEFSDNANLRSAKPEVVYPKGLRFEIGAY